jgi:hypothetical protein
MTRRKQSCCEFSKKQDGVKGAAVSQYSSLFRQLTATNRITKNKNKIK